MSQIVWMSMMILVLTLSGCKTAKMKRVKAPQSGAINQSAGTPEFQQPAKNETEEVVDFQEDKTPANRNPADPSPARPMRTNTPTKPTVKSTQNMHARPAPTCTSGCGTQITAPLPTPPKSSGPELCGEGAWECAKPPPVRQECRPVNMAASIQQPKLDILLVLDTSASLRGEKGSDGGELAQLAGAMSYFVNGLDPETDIRIGIMPAYGPGMPGHGRLYKMSSDGPAVIDLNERILRAKKTNPSATAAQLRALVLKNVGEQLKTRLNSIPPEPGKSKGKYPSAQGEAMLLSLYNSMTDSRLIEALKHPGQNEPGLLRPETPLAVIIVSDEQDVCFNYAGSGFNPPLVDTTKDSSGKTILIPDRIETAFFNSDACQKAVNGRDPLTPGHVYDALKSQTPAGLILSAIAYIDNNIPANVIEKEKENEQGHGILDLVKLADNGPVANMADVKANQTSESAGADSFNRLLSGLGKHANFKMNYTNRFDCVSDADPDNVDRSTLEVRFYDERNQEIGLFSAACSPGKTCPKGVLGQAVWETQTSPSGARSGRVTVDTRKLEALLKQSQYTRGTVRMSFIQKAED